MKVQCFGDDCEVILERPAYRLAKSNGRAWCAEHWKSTGRRMSRAERKDKGIRKTEWWKGVCDGCGKELEKPFYEVRRTNYHGSCYKKYGASKAGKRGGKPRSGGWSYERYPGEQPETASAVERYGSYEAWMLDDGYVVFLWKGHPIASSNGRVPEHRAVAYEYEGDGVRGHHVDHDNAIRSDNRWENLKVMTPSDHMKKTWERDTFGRALRFIEWMKNTRPEELESLLEEFDRKP